MKHKLSKLCKMLAVAFATAFLVAPLATNAVTLPTQQPTVVKAAKGDQGVDWSKYQGNYGAWGLNNDKFSISQVGGYYNGSFVEQYTYPTQVATTIAQGRRAHTYIYAQFSGRWQADQMLNYYLPKVQTPKGSIVMLDVESGNPDTDSVLYALKRVQDAGYTAVLYGYKNFLVNHLDLHAIARQYPLALAEYPDYNVTKHPNYNYFPSFENIGIFQFTSTYVAGGLDGDVDLTGITDNGYKNGNAQKPKTNTPATNTGKQLHQDTHNYTVKSGDSWWSIANKFGMDMNALAQLNGTTINTVIHTNQVLRVADHGSGSQVSNKVQKPMLNLISLTGLTAWGTIGTVKMVPLLPQHGYIYVGEPSRVLQPLPTLDQVPPLNMMLGQNMMGSFGAVSLEVTAIMDILPCGTHGTMSLTAHSNNYQCKINYFCTEKP